MVKFIGSVQTREITLGNELSDAQQLSAICGIALVAFRNIVNGIGRLRNNEKTINTDACKLLAELGNA